MELYLHPHMVLQLIKHRDKPRSSSMQTTASTSKIVSVHVLIRLEAVVSII
jgi:hypothetical protein